MSIFQNSERPGPGQDSATTDPATSSHSVSANSFTPAIAAAAHNLRQPEQLSQLIAPSAVRQARRLQRLIRFPHLLEEVYVRGYENLPVREERAPILALSHKKKHDVAAIVELIAGRPLNRFHDITLIAQAGLFSAMYAYRDMIPRFCKRGLAGWFLRRPAIFAAQRVGNLLSKTLSDVNAYPVYREGRDVPACEEDFRNPIFAGPRITGRSYTEFRKFASRETRQSLMRVQQDMDQFNRFFFIMPEGGYQYDGTIAPLHDFLGVFAYRKQAPTVFGALSYDELCPDRLGRITAFINLLTPTPAPESKTAVPDFLASGRQALTENTVILASHLLAAAVQTYLTDGRFFRPSELRDRFEEQYEILIHAVRDRDGLLIYDPGLDQARYRNERFRRFMRYGAPRYFRRVGGGRFRVSHESINRFARTERTVNDIQWNLNHARHLFGSHDRA